MLNSSKISKQILKEILKQASNAGVSRQCLEDKMSKGARNVDIGNFYKTRPPVRVQIWVIWDRVKNEKVKETIDNTYFI